MRFTILILFLFLLLTQRSYGQITVREYLAKNQQDLLQDNSMDIGRARIIGFGALHGSAKTEDAEILLLNELVKNHGLKFYLPETDFSTANYFQKYIESGDQLLLKELVQEYGAIVPQEKSIEVFEKWQKIRPIFQENKVRIIGVDKITSYKYSVKEVLSITQNKVKWPYRDSLVALDDSSNVVWSIFENQGLKSLIRCFVEDYEKNVEMYRSEVLDTFRFNHILQNFKHTYQTYSRERFIYDNYVVMNKKYSLETGLQFARFGIFHIMKSPINENASFFSRLIEGKVYSSEEIITVLGFLTKSSVLWSKYDKNGNQYFITKKGFGIGDYWNESFYKIKELKRNKLSDITLFRLNEKNSPYSKIDDYRLIKIKKIFGKSNWYPEKGKNTLSYIDYAILISNSAANRPITE